ncbi:MAG: hypothetical protein JRH08_03235 [Deltaproteobacteria bacterium]|nr:hypothetical protein [Deltaproteobacteria bacterium]MBW1927943.1 hypothetical protein [Deltaproteobacteria bacterium]MBW2024816.1 hypothetical protein [Deltaproteobacteria bacterium]MBW2124714.1 hypothetical protein [Deltaproteobacteria bacterium]RLB24177.1 MAG: hypothetical protein DRG76_02230 [Deltaproteobacteria bacterium]
MLIVPKEKPVVEKLNSYYLHIKKLFEHYQGELGCGAIHFKSPFAEGVIYFDKDEMLNGFFREDGNTMKGKEAVEHIVEAVDSYNFTISIHQIPAEYIYLWANVPDSEEVYKNLSTEFTELGGLVKKMKDEKLTGFINVIMRDGISGGMIFFNGGQVVGGSFSWRPPSAGDIEQGIEELIEKCKEAGATFYVGKIIPQTERLSLEPQQVTQKNSWHVITALEELLGIFEEVVRSNGTPGKDFRTLLKKKFLSKANKYDFLDPFAGEFEYADRKITFVGEATDEDLARGVIESVKELAKELKVSPKLLEALGPWYQQNKKALTRFGIRLF